MRVLVCGGRGFQNREDAFASLDRLHAKRVFTHVIEGDARGADRLAGEWARSRGVALSVYPAAWEDLGRRAGPIRNQRMLDEGRPDLVVALPGGRGTRDMIARAVGAGIEVLRPLG